jgi:hypothetical protein
MDTKFLKSLLAKLPKDDGLFYVAAAIFAVATLYIFYNGQLTTILLSVGVALVLYALTADVSVSLIAGALAGLIAIHYSRTKREGFKSSDKEDDEGFKAKDEDDEGFNDKESEEDARKRAKTGKKAKKPAPDNGSRGEFFEPGKKYKMPSEGDDKEFHLDAGTTFMNAYKSLKPDQISAMTKDTQELINTQKQLMSTLHTLKPLITDGKQMMDTFQGYFGNDGTGDLSKLAANFGGGK